MITEERQGYHGFLALECYACGRVRAFCSREPITEYECLCGQRVVLEELRPVYAYCKCGRRWKYLTNRQEARMTLRCLNCGAPMDLEINGHGTAFVTVNEALRPVRVRRKRRRAAR